ncbi:Alpha/Beta hydrolase protein [Whalleya microplaca]|nr:Alpha/Beta hydrolase protein [Whalleya microplaca]
MASRSSSSRNTTSLSLPAAELTAIKPIVDMSPEYRSEFQIIDLRFHVPLNYSKMRSDSNSIEISLKLMCGYKHSLAAPATAVPTTGRLLESPDVDTDEVELTPSNIHAILSKRSLVVYLSGGPGDRNPPVRMSELNQFFLQKGYWVLYPEYRGTGDSSAIEYPAVSDQTLEHFRKLRHYRQTAIARDLESVRRRLQPADTNAGTNSTVKWSLLGQSLGGWVALTYMSFWPAGLREVFLTGGLPPVRRSPREVYIKLFHRVIRRNNDYYAKYPDDVRRVRRLVRYLAAQRKGRGIWLPRGGWLTAQRFLCLGRILGDTEKWTDVHELLKDMESDVYGPGNTEFGLGQATDRRDRAAWGETMSHATLWLYETLDSWKLEHRPLYAVLHEAMYCNKEGERSRWAASEVAARFPQFWWVNCNPEDLSQELEEREEKAGGGSNSTNDEEETRLYFSGEMVYPFFFHTYKELGKFKFAAEWIAQYKWDERLYDVEALRRNIVPVIALSYGARDMYVDSEYSLETWEKIGGPKSTVHQDRDWEHGAIRQNTANVLQSIWQEKESLDTSE